MNVLKLKKTAISIVVTSSIFLSQAASALPNGKPFQELNALIEENATAIDENGNLIEQNSTAILSLSAELSTLDGRLGVLETNVDGLTTRFGLLETTVTANTNDITLAFARIASVQSELSTLNTAVATNTQAISDAETAIQAAEAELAQLDADLAALYASVATNQTAISAVQDDIAAAEAYLLMLEADVVTNAEEIQTTNDNLNDLNASLSALEAIVASNTARITQTESDIFDINNNIITLVTQYNDLQALVGANAGASDAAISALKTELLALIAATEADIDYNKTELLALNQALLQLAQDNSNIAQDLRDQMLALALLVDSNSTSITALQAQVGTLSSTLTTLNAEYNSLSSLYSQLSGHVDDHHNELNDLRAAIDMLTLRVGTTENDVDSLSALHLDPQCLEPYKELTSASRNTSNVDASRSNTVQCDNGAHPDDWRGPNWYRFSGDAGNRMPETAPVKYSCGAHAPGWLNGTHPVSSDGVVDRQVSFHWSTNTSLWTASIKVVNCGGFMLYKLPNAPVCSLRYCGE